MTRTLFFLTALAAMLAAMTAVFIQLELADKGASLLFQHYDGGFLGDRYMKLSTLHAAFSFLAVTLLGTTLCSAARSKGAPLSGFFTKIGCVAALLVCATALLAVIPAPLKDPTGTGLALYPPLSTQPQSYLVMLTEYAPFDLGFDPSIGAFTRLLFLPAATMLFMGAYAMLATLPSLRWLSWVGLVVITPITLFAASLIFTQNHTIIGALYLIGALPLLACASIRLIDAAPSWLMVLTVGIIATIVGQIILLSLNAQFSVIGPTLEPAAYYIFPLGIAFFALPALILYDREEDLPAWGTGLALGAILLPLAQWTTYLAALAIDALPSSYRTPTHILVPNIQLFSTNVMLFLVLYLVTITLVRRSAR